MASFTSSTVGTLPLKITLPLIIKAGVLITPRLRISAMLLMISKSSFMFNSFNALSTIGANLLPPQQICSKILISMVIPPKFYIYIAL